MEALQRIEKGETIAKIAHDVNVNESSIRSWKRTFENKNKNKNISVSEYIITEKKRKFKDESLPIYKDFLKELFTQTNQLKEESESKNVVTEEMMTKTLHSLEKKYPHFVEYFKKPKKST